MTIRHLPGSQQPPDSPERRDDSWLPKVVCVAGMAIGPVFPDAAAIAEERVAARQALAGMGQAAPILPKDVPLQVALGDPVGADASETRLGDQEPVARQPL